MNLYIVRHGDALNGRDDSARPLSEHGRQEISALANALNGRVRVSEILHSGKTRAEQTATILHQTAFANASLSVRAGLTPNDDPSGLANDLLSWPNDLMLVSHLPFVSCLASSLIDDTPWTIPFLFNTGTCLALQRRADTWMIQWMLDPSLLRS